MSYSATLFDLDGTLLDTLQDIADAANHVLETNGLPTHTVDAYRLFVGGGVGDLMANALPDSASVDVATLVEAFRSRYAANINVHTAPYPGVATMLDALTERGLRMSVLSNKPDHFTKQLVAELLSRWRFDEVLGSRPEVPKKPDPTAAADIAELMATPPARFLYVGDSAVDMETARGAGMFPVGVTWGFRSRAELHSAGALAIIERPEDLITLL